MTLSQHMDLMEALQPDIYTALGDEVLPAAKDKRIKDSVERTLRWLDATLTEHAERKMSCPPPMAAIQGALDVRQRLHSAQESAKRAVSGTDMFLHGLSSTYSLSSSEQQTMQ